MATVSYKESFLLVGGQGYPDYINEILKYEPDTEDWTLKTEQMATPRVWFGAVLVEHSTMSCA